MKGKAEKKNDDFGFDDFDMLTKPAAKHPPAKKGRGAAAGRGGRGRGRPKKGAATTQVQRKSSFDFDDDLDKDGDDDDVEVKPPKEEPPKLPKLRLGAMLASRKEVEKNSHRRDSNDSTEATATSNTKVPRLKIKLGPKPEAKPEPDTETISEAVISKNNKNLDQPQSDLLHRSSGGGGVQDDLETDKEAKDAAGNMSNEVSKPSPASSPTKKGFRIDSLAERLMKGTSTGGSANELESIFGPSGVPLDMSNSGDTGKEAKNANANEDSSRNETKSELDLLREEIESGGAAAVAATGGTPTASKTPSFIQSSPAGASPHADTVYGPLKKAINASRSAAEKEAQNKASSGSFSGEPSVENYEHTARKHLKFKFKVNDADRHASTSTPPPPSVTPQSSQPSVTSSNSSMIPPSSSASSLAQSVTSLASSAAASSAPAAASSNHYKRMNRKKELLNQYYGQDIYTAPTNGPTSSSQSSSSSSMLPTSYDQLSSYAGSSEPQPPRPVIKMPKAVASVTSVPTRADYQSQLEANLERKRKREKGDLGLKNDSASSKAMDKGKKKRGRGAKNADDDIEYRPKIKDASNNVSATSGSQNTSASNSLNDKMSRKTRGKPPKKCLADSPEHEHDPGDLKAESMKFAEAIRAQFDESTNEKTTTSSKKGGKKKRKGAPLSDESNNKTPRLVIKFSKDSNALTSRENGGRDEYDFNDDSEAKVPFVDGTVDSAMSSINNSPAEAKVTKLKIKI